MTSKPQLPVPQITSREVVKQIAMDIGKETCAYVEVMYPEVWAAGNSGFRLSLRNHIYNEIMAAIDVTDEGAIIRRLDDRKKFRRNWKAMWRKLRAGQSISGED